MTKYATYYPVIHSGYVDARIGPPYAWWRLFFSVRILAGWYHAILGFVLGIL